MHDENRGLARWLAAQERFDELAARARRAHGPRLIDLSYANPVGGPGPEVIAALHRAIDGAGDLDFQYTPYGGKTAPRRLIAAHLEQLTGLPLAFGDVVLTPGAMSALNVVFRALLGGGKAVVLAPCWIDYPLYLENLGVPFELVPLADDKHLDLAAIARALAAPGVRGVVFSNPSCPTGVVFREDELRELASLVAAAEARSGAAIYLVGDEVHRDLIWGPAGSPMKSVLELHPNGVSVYSFGKKLHLQGQRIGYVAVSPRTASREEVRRSLERHLRAMGFCAPTSLMQRAVGDLLAYTPPLEPLRAKQERVRAALSGMGYEVTPAEATFFTYARAPSPDDFAFAERMARLGVLVLPSSLFHEPGWFRLSLTLPEQAILDALPRFADGRGAPREERAHAAV